MSDGAKDIYFTTRLLMFCYWLTCPLLLLMFFGLLYLFPNSNWRLVSIFFRRHWIYLRNLIPFAWISLGIVLVANTVLTVFYLIDIWAIGNASKYSVYWTANGSESALLNFFSIIFFGSILYWIIAIFSYKKFWFNYFQYSIRDIFRNS